MDKPRLAYWSAPINNNIDDIFHRNLDKGSRKSTSIEITDFTRIRPLEIHARADSSDGVSIERESSQSACFFVHNVRL